MKRLISILLIVLLFLTGCTSGGGEETGLTSFSANSLDGITRTEALFKDHPLTMVNLWGTYCGPCIEEMPALAELHQEYADQGVQVVGIVADVMNHTDSQAEKARNILENAGANYVNLLPNQSMAKFLQPFVYVPTTVFLDQEGNQVGEPYIGARSKEDWKQIIDKLLKETK